MKCGTGATYKSRERKRSRASVTPGKTKGPTCSLTSIGGMPRKFWTSSKSWKHPRYKDFVDFQNKANK